MGDYLQLSPPELKFRFELRKNIPVTLSLHNPGTERVAFKATPKGKLAGRISSKKEKDRFTSAAVKTVGSNQLVKTTSPKKYCVRPSSGYVEPGATKDVQVIMQAQKEYPPSLTDCKDKFLVQSLKIGREVTDVVPELFEPSTGKDIKQSKLRVVLVGPPKPPSPVPEGVEEDPSPVKNAFKENGPDLAGAAGTQQYPAVGTSADPNSEVAKMTRERNRLRDQLAKVENDKAEIKKRLDMVGFQGTQGSSQVQKTMLQDGNFTMAHLAIVAVVAFLIGYLLRLGA